MVWTRASEDGLAAVCERHYEGTRGRSVITTVRMCKVVPQGRRSAGSQKGGEAELQPDSDLLEATKNTAYSQWIFRIHQRFLLLDQKMCVSPAHPFRSATACECIGTIHQQKWYVEAEAHE